MRLVLAAFLCFATWMSVGHATHGPMSGCCPRRSNTTVPLKKILNYTIQTEGICQVSAVAFLTKLGKRICSDPDSHWAKRAILKVDEETRKKKALHAQRQNEEGSTSSTPTHTNTPAASTASTNTPQTKCRNRRRRCV